MPSEDKELEEIFGEGGALLDDEEDLFSSAPRTDTERSSLPAPVVVPEASAASPPPPAEPPSSSSSSQGVFLEEPMEDMMGPGELAPAPDLSAERRLPPPAPALSKAGSGGQQQAHDGLGGRLLAAARAGARSLAKAESGTHATRRSRSTTPPRAVRLRPEAKQVEGRPGRAPSLPPKAAVKPSAPINEQFPSPSAPRAEDDFVVQGVPKTPAKQPPKAPVAGPPVPPPPRAVPRFPKAPPRPWPPPVSAPPPRAPVSLGKGSSSSSSSSSAPAKKPAMPKPGGKIAAPIGPPPGPPPSLPPPQRRLRGRPVRGSDEPASEPATVAPILGKTRPLEDPAGSDRPVAKGRIHLVSDDRQGYEQVLMVSCTNETGDDEMESVLLVNPGGYAAWLTTLGGLNDSSRLSWRERNLGREVPRQLAGNFFDEAMGVEVKKWYDEKCVSLIRRDEARNLISGRFVLRWKPQKGPVMTQPSPPTKSSSSKALPPPETQDAELARLLKSTAPVPKAAIGPKGTIYAHVSLIPPVQVCPKAGPGQASLAPFGYKATARLCAHGFRDTDWWVRRSSPTARRETKRVGFTITLREGWRAFSLDATRAFLQTKLLSRNVCMTPPPQANVPAGYVWLLLKPVYGLNDAAHGWYVEFRGHVLFLGFVSVPGDQCTYVIFLHAPGKASRCMGWMCVHVDDTLFSIHPAWLDWFVVTLRRRVVFGDIDADSFTFAGIDLETQFSLAGTSTAPLPIQITESQQSYVAFLEEVPLPMERRTKPLAKATAMELRDFRGGLGGVLWVTATRVELAHGCSVLAGKVHDLKIQDILDLNKLIRKAKAFEGVPIIHRVLSGKLVVLTFGDSNLDPAGERIFQGTMVFIGGAISGQVAGDLEAYEDASIPANFVLGTSRKSQKAVTASLSAEVHGAVAAYDHGRYVQILTDFFLGEETKPVLEWPLLRRVEKPSLTALLHYCDCDSLIKHLLAEGSHLIQDKRFVGYLRVLEEALQNEEIKRLFHVASRHNLSDCLTKIMVSVALEWWRQTGKVRVEPGEYGARAEARRAERRAKAATARKRAEEKLLMPTEI